MSDSYPWFPKNASIAATSIACSKESLSSGSIIGGISGSGIEVTVSSIIGGARILADNGKCGRAVETDDQAVEAFMELLRGDKEEQRKGCRESISRFGLEKYIGQIEELLDEIMEV